MTTFTTGAGLKSAPYPVPRGAIVTVTPGPGASALVECTSASAADVANNIAAWSAWPNGTVSGMASSLLATDNMFLRIEAAGGSISCEIDESPSARALAPFRSDWATIAGSSLSTGAKSAQLGIPLFEGAGSATPGTSAGANTVIHSAAMVVNSAGETVFRVDASASQATGNWFEIIIPNSVFGYGPVSANAASVEFTTNPGQGTPLTISLANSNAYTSYVQATRTLAAPAVGDPFQTFGRMAFTVLDSEWVKTGFTGATSEQTWGAAKIRVPVNNGQRRVFDLRSFRVGGTKGKGRLCVISDDGYASFYRLGVPIFEEYGIKTTTAVIADSVGAGFDAVTLKDLQDYVARGHQCVAHGPIGGTGNIIDKYTTNADRVADMTFHRDWLVSNSLAVGGAEKCYVWPQGRYAPTAGDISLLDAAHTAGFRLGRSATPSATAVQVRALSKESHQRFILPIVGHNYAGADNTADDAAETANINTIVTRIQSLGANRADGFLMLHRVVGKGLATATNISIETDRVRTLAAAIRAEIDAGRLEAVWMSELQN